MKSNADCKSWDRGELTSAVCRKLQEYEKSGIDARLG
jgi:hypothetical protein